MAAQLLDSKEVHMSTSLRLVALSLVVSALPAIVLAQAPAVDVLRSQTANSGLYDNRIANFTPPNDYTEVCIVAGAVLNDQNPGGSSPVGGNCDPGNIGWLVEREERSALVWEAARMECLKDSMRLPEPFEWKYGCANAALLGLDSMINDYEWASNFAVHQSDSDNHVGATVFGLGACDVGSWGEVARSDGGEATFTYRCVR